MSSRFVNRVSNLDRVLGGLPDIGAAAGALGGAGKALKGIGRGRDVVLGTTSGINGKRYVDALASNFSIVRMIWRVIMNTNFNHLFEDFGFDYCQNPLISDDLVHAAEKSLNCRLPKAYIETLKISNGGILHRNSILYNAFGENKVATLFILYGLGGIDSIDSLGEDNVIRNQVLISNWSYPKGSVIFSHAGDSGFYLDYSGCGQDGEPEVYFQISLSPSEITQTLVRPTFLEFVADLTTKQIAEESFNRIQ